MLRAFSFQVLSESSSYALHGGSRRLPSKTFCCVQAALQHIDCHSVVPPGCSHQLMMIIMNFQNVMPDRWLHAKPVMLSASRTPNWYEVLNRPRMVITAVHLSTYLHQTCMHAGQFVFSSLAGTEVQQGELLKPADVLACSNAGCPRVGCGLQRGDSRLATVASCTAHTNRPLINQAAERMTSTRNHTRNNAC